jgi:hypothetical protein
MKNLPFPALMAILAALSATPAAAQQRGSLPQQAPHTMNPSPAPPDSSTSRLQQQMLDQDVVILNIRKQREHDQQQRGAN